MSISRTVLRGGPRDSWRIDGRGESCVEVGQVASERISVQTRAWPGSDWVQANLARADFIEAMEKALNVVVIEGSEIDAISVEPGLADRVVIDGGLYARSSDRHTHVLRNLAAERWFAAHPTEPSPAARTLIAKMRAAGVDVNVAQAEDLLSRGVRP